MIKYMKKFFQKDIEIDVMDILPTEDEYDFSDPIGRISSKNDKSKKNFIIIDDSKGIVSILEDTLEELENEGEIDLSGYNIMTFYNRYAPFILKGTLKKLEPTKVDLAIIDIVLPGKVRVNGEFKRMDGIDVAVLLHEKYDCNNFVFFTGNVVSDYIEYIQEKVDRFKNVFGKDIESHIIFKSELDDSETKEKFINLVNKTQFGI